MKFVSVYSRKKKIDLQNKDRQYMKKVIHCVHPGRIPVTFHTKHCVLSFSCTVFSRHVIGYSLDEDKVGSSSGAKVSVRLVSLGVDF